MRRIQLLYQLLQAGIMNQCPCKNILSYSRLKYIVMSNTRPFSLAGNCLPKSRNFNFKPLNLFQKRFLATSLVPDVLTIRVTVSQMKRYLTENEIPFEIGHTCLILDCPFCAYKCKVEPRKNPGKLYINMTTGMFICYTCKQIGSWQDFQDSISLMTMQKTGQIKEFRLPKLEANAFITDSIKESLLSQFADAIKITSLPQQELETILWKFKLRGLLPETFDKFNVRLTSDKKSIIFPLHDPQKQLVGLQSLSEICSEEEKISFNFFPNNIPTAVFGGLNSTKTNREIVLTANPLDALAIYQETNTTAVSLPSGINHLPPEVLPFFESFDKIVIWFGNTIKHWEAAKMFAKKFSEKRCHFIRPREDQPSSLIGLQTKRNLLLILKESQPISHKSITTFHSLRQDIFDELSHVEQVAGTKWKRYPGLNHLLKGHRKGELTIFTGPTGSGKTTFMSEYSLDLCMQGVNTLWGSFEIKNVRLGKMMLTQFALLPLEKHLDQYDLWADKFERIPLYFMTFHGQQSIRHVLDAMSHAVYVHDIQHVIVDNVQFMLGSDETHTRIDRFWKQDLLLSAFRKFATQHNCHVTLVMHPRKENEMEDLNNSSIFGGAKASQEADNILILQDKRLSMLKGKKYIQITKNRFDGDTGIIPLEFDKETLTFSLRKKKKPETPKL